jgi:hypothetical protein
MRPGQGEILKNTKAYFDIMPSGGAAFLLKAAAL